MENRSVQFSIEDAPDLLTVDEVASYTRVSRNLIYALARDNKIPSIKLGRLVRFPKGRFIEWIQSGGLQNVG